MSSVTTSPSETPPSSIAGSASLTDTSVLTVSTVSAQETEEQKKYRQYWWKTGNFHPKANWNKVTLPYELMTGVTLDEYIIQTDKHNVKGFWEWENNTVRVIEFSSGLTRFCGAMTTRTHGGGKEPNASFRPFGKPQVPRDGYDGMHMPWPNLIVEVAYAQEEYKLKDKIENYWLLPDRVHDAIAIKLDYIPNTVPTVMTAWHYCVNNRTDAGALAPVMYEFGTIDRQGNQINILPGQCVINISMTSEVELLKQRVTTLEAENTKLKQIIEEIANLRIENTKPNQIIKQNRITNNVQFL
ncbi:hypothetical protein Glove_303g157 [Diversispora epigaea]|uniref:Uncharacterized protein n=1 Tax=Diversispora epigaea TaxID=1348612 RepID=A0A397HZP9_9GLOM|nr:hypothetical protein Glove_303g157 [Diversispora epigaea]